MTHKFHLLALMTFLALTGCATDRLPPGAPCITGKQVRQRLVEVPVLREASARVRDVRISHDRERILVLLDLPADSKAPSSEILFKHDGFQRYFGSWWTTTSLPATQAVIKIDFGQK